jgi:hypothetical protein
MTKLPTPLPLLPAGLVAAVLALTAGPALADANEAARKTADTVETAVTKSEAAVKRGGSAVGSGIERGARWAADGSDKLAAKLGLPKGTAADARRAQDTPQRKADVHPDPTQDPVPQAPARPAPKTAAAAKATK